MGYLDGTLTHILAKRPIILGHEIAGEITELGEGVTGFAVGDRVAVRGGVETPGTAMDGGYATRVAVPQELLVPIPDNVNFEHAAIATDAAITSYHAVRVRGGVGAGTRVGIVGLGGLGLLGAQAALAAGAEVFAAEINPEAFAAAEESGVTKIFRDVTELAQFDLDVIVDFAGFGSTPAGAIAAVVPGGKVVQVGLGVASAEVPLANLVVKEVELLGSLGGTKEDLTAVLDLISEEKIRPLTNTIDFEEISTGLRRLEEGTVRGRLVARVPQ